MALAIPELYLKVTYNQKDVTSTLSPYVTAIEATDTLGKKDSISITLEDLQDKWKGPWYPVKTDTISLEFGYKGGAILKIGKFFIDEINFSSAPDTVQIKAISADISKPLETPRSRTFRDKSLKQIVEEIAGEAGLKVHGKVDNIQFLCRRQNKQTDLGFLKALADDYGYFMAVKENVLIFSKMSEVRKSKTSLKLHKNDCLSISLKDKTSSIYKACTIKYWSAKDKKQLTYTETVTGLKTGDTLIIKDRVENQEQAKARAKAALTAKNERQVTGTISVPGSSAYSAGAQIELTGLGVLSGVYTIISAKHSFGSSGWTCTLNVSRNELKPDDTQKGSRSQGKGPGKQATVSDPMGWATITDDRGITYSVRREIAARFETLRQLCKQQWPGQMLWISSTTGDQHESFAHRDGRAVDFGVSGISNSESWTLNSLCEQAGFVPYNEYVYRSKYWSGEHMHISWGD